MRWIPLVLVLCACMGDKGTKDLEDISDYDAYRKCTCAEGTLTAVAGCEHFGGDQEECTGWHSCEVEAGFEEGTEYATGTELTCYDCTIRLDCPAN